MRLAAVLRRFSIATAMALAAPLAPAAEISLLSGGAVEPGLKPALAAFESATGHAVRVTFNPAPQIARRIESGEGWDAVIAPVGVLDTFAKSSRIGPERVGIGRVGIGVAVRPGAPAPDVSSAESLKRAVLEADSVVFNRASTGIVVEGLFKRMGIHEQVEPKASRHPDGASVMEHLLKGHGNEIGFGAITEILLFRDRGLRLVGPLPPGLQTYTMYTAALPAKGAGQPEAARQLLAYLASPPARAMFAAAGVEPAPAER